MDTNVDTTLDMSRESCDDWQDDRYAQVILMRMYADALKSIIRFETGKMVPDATQTMSI